jgi:NADH:ubiquinone reductase (H+-translocating)
MVRSHTDLAVDQRGLLILRADLHVGTDAGPVRAPGPPVTMR